MAVLVNTIMVAAKLLSPALVETLDKVYDIFGIKEELRNYEALQKFCPYAGSNVTKGNALFPRLDMNVETEYIHSLSAK